jgi:hypothetical protein
MTRGLPALFRKAKFSTTTSTTEPIKPTEKVKATPKILDVENSLKECISTVR